ncbi:MAG: hypothetical protein Q8M01_02270 [Rubrivivax sp.]|nr:hypothetical protein [Rubrivivax sp.]
MKPPARRPAGAFLAGAGGRLLPASLPWRFFGAGVVFHAGAWLALLAGADDWTRWQGGLGWPLAALHLFTLGTLLSCAIGASLQLLPVATRQPVRSQRLMAALWWAYVPGVALLALGMGRAEPGWMAAGAAAMLGALAAFGTLLGLNLRGARGMPGVVLHGWGALAALGLLGASAIALVALWLGRPLLDAAAARGLHLLAAVFGVMGLLVFGLSYVLLPMFALAPVPDERRQVASGAAAMAAIALAGVAAFGVAPTVLRLAAIAAGTFALALHLQLMQQTLATGMRSDFGRALVLMRIGWGSLALALLLALALVLGAPAETFGRLFGIAVIGGWLLSFLFGVLQRILPFLASMHAARGQKRPPTPSALTLDRPLAWHLACHVAALALLAAATLAAAPALATALARAAALVGLAGALSFGTFFAVLLRRLQRSREGANRSPS